MLKITSQRIGNDVTLELEGKLAGAWVAELRRFWRELKAGRGTEGVEVRVCAVTFIDAAGKLLLSEMYLEGVELVAAGCMNQAIVAEIIEACSEGRKRSSSTPKNSPGIIFWILFLGTVGAGSTRAQTTAGDLTLRSAETATQLAPAEKSLQRLTLNQAVALALKQNPQVEMGSLAAAQSAQDKAIALSALLPQAELGVSDAVRRGNLESAIGFKFPGAPQHFGPFQVFQAGPQFGMPIVDLTLWRRWQAAREGAGASHAQSQSVREQVVLLVVSQYLGALRTSADVKAARSRVELAQALFNQAGDLKKQGVGTGIDTLRSNVELQNEKQRLITSEAALQTTLYGLSRLLNIDPQQEIALADELNFFETPEFTVSESLQSAYARRPEMKELEAQVRQAQALKRAASESRLPALRFDGTWGYQGLSARTAIPAYQYQVSIGMPLFTSGRIHAELARAELEIKRRSEQRTDLRNSIAVEVKTAIVNLEAARHEVEFANLGVNLANEEVVQARDRFNAGVTNNIEVISAQDALARANDNQITALYRFNQARADLARATGQMEALYSK
ncbi:MAG TPA: TolC family protein [Candidatus Dormibacteraeota bacterium]|nr:TolC family protein [Candidatus Dormibacteraeota bacterium]